MTTLPTLAKNFNKDTHWITLNLSLMGKPPYYSRVIWCVISLGYWGRGYYQNVMVQVAKKIETSSRDVEKNPAITSFLGTLKDRMGKNNTEVTIALNSALNLLRIPKPIFTEEDLKKKITSVKPFNIAAKAEELEKKYKTLDQLPSDFEHCESFQEAAEHFATVGSALNEILPQLFLGNEESSGDSTFTFVVSATTRQRTNVLQQRHQIPKSNPQGMDVDWVDVLDMDNIAVCVKVIHKAISEKKTVLVHCQKGKDLSPTIVAAYLMWRFKISAEEAKDYIKHHRPIVTFDVVEVKRTFKGQGRQSTYVPVAWLEERTGQIHTIQ